MCEIEYFQRERKLNIMNNLYVNNTVSEFSCATKESLQEPKNITAHLSTEKLELSKQKQDKHFSNI